MKPLLIASLLFIAMASCLKQERKSVLAEGAEGKEDKLQQMVLLDPISIPLKKDSAGSVTEAAYFPLYVGEVKDSIWLNDKVEMAGFITFIPENYKYPDSADLMILIDTSKIIGSSHFSYPPPPPKGATEKDLLLLNKQRRDTIESYPLIIKNEGEDTLMVGFYDFMPLILEAVDSLGVWRPIQEPVFFYCGTGRSELYLPPKNIVLTSCKIFTGSYRTKMRVVYGPDKAISSNEFWGTMNYGQFGEREKK